MIIIIRKLKKKYIHTLINKIYARNCKLIKIESNKKDIFLDNNHIQGKCTSSINLGLEYNGEIVSLMTFGKRSINNKNEFELIRFCNKINTVVIGSASKLFKHFISNYNFDQIISFADTSHFNGDLYKNGELYVNNFDGGTISNPLTIDNNNGLYINYNPGGIQQYNAKLYFNNTEGFVFKSKLSTAATYSSSKITVGDVYFTGDLYKNGT